MGKLLVIDNYDSFTYNLVHYLESCTEDEIQVIRNDEIDFESIGEFDRIVLSPGPGLPSGSGELLPLIRKFYCEKPILGVCIGMQAIAQVFNGKLKQLEKVYHGIDTPLVIKSRLGIFKGLPKHIRVGRYHSWVVDKENPPLDFNITAIDEGGNPMAMQHNTLPLFAVQFHPESVMTEYGMEMISNWLKLTKEPVLIRDQT